MNIKNISIVLTVLLVAIAVFVFMQKGNYVDQATSHYTEETGKTFSKTNEIIGNVNNSVNVNKAVWTLVCKTIETAKSSKDQATLEAKYVPSVKGSNSMEKMTRRFEYGAFSFVSTFSKVDKKNGSLDGLVSVDVNALLGIPVAEEVEEEEEGDGEEEAVEEAPAPKKAAKSAKGKKGKKGKKR